MLRALRRWWRGRPAATGVGFTDHAVDRLLQRAAVSGGRPAGRRELQRLHTLEGQVRRRPPSWASLAPAPAYLVIGDWLCLPLRPGRREATWDATTLICRQDATWSAALSRGWVTARPANLQRAPRPGVLARLRRRPGR